MKKERNNRKKVRIKGENSTYFKVVYNIRTVIGQVGNLCVRERSIAVSFIFHDSGISVAIATATATSAACLCLLLLLCIASLRLV